MFSKRNSKPDIKFKVTINGKKYKIPATWSEVTVGQYMQMRKVDTSLSDAEILNKNISILTGIEPHVIPTIPFRQFKTIESLLSFINKSVEYDATENRIITVNGKQYGFVKSFDDISQGEFGYLSDMCDNADERLHEIFAVLYRPITKIRKRWFRTIDFTVEEMSEDKVAEVKERAEIFKEHMSIQQVMYALLFFCLFVSESLKVLQSCSVNHSKKI